MENKSISVILSEILPSFGLPKISKNLTVQVIVMKFGRRFFILKIKFILL